MFNTLIDNDHIMGIIRYSMKQQFEIAIIWKRNIILNENGKGNEIQQTHYGWIMSNDELNFFFLNSLNSFSYIFVENYGSGDQLRFTSILLELQ